MRNTPKANRLHIAIFGRRNAGKSSLINAITDQEIALVSDVAGTTTDPVYKSMELLPLGPVVIIDTAGIDDEGTIGALRVKKTKEVIAKTDLAIIVFDSSNSDWSMEKQWYEDLKAANINVVGAVNKIDVRDTDLAAFQSAFEMPFVKVSANNRENMDALKDMIKAHAPIHYENPYIVGDILDEGDVVVLVAPQDIQAPKGRLILPQVQTIRDVLDTKAMALTVTSDQLDGILGTLNKKPDLVITDSQVFKMVNEKLPRDVKLTSFSILMARYKGELDVFKAGAEAIDQLKDGDKVLIAEACTHHALEGDIGREKLPRWLREHSGAELKIEVKAGIDFAEDLSEYKLIVHCGACMFNRKQMVTRIVRSENQNVPITNYGIAIAHMNGILDRVTEMF